jgi:hypothetical protein
VTVSKTATAQGAQAARGSAGPIAGRAPVPQGVGGASSTAQAVRPAIAYHATKTAHLASIRRLGLLPQNPWDNPEWWDIEPGEYEAEAVYVFGDDHDAVVWGSWHERDVIITVDVGGLETEPCGLLPSDGESAFRVYEPIMAERLIDAWEFVELGGWFVPLLPDPGNVFNMDNVGIRVDRGVPV